MTVLAFVISLAAACGVAYFLFSAIIFGAVVMGGIGGFFVGFALYNLAFHWTNSLAALIIISFGLAIVAAFLAYKFFDEIVVFGTALIGAYIFIRGISIFAGHYPNEVMIFKQLREGIEY